MQITLTQKQIYTKNDLPPFHYTYAQFADGVLERQAEQRAFRPFDGLRRTHRFTLLLAFFVRVLLGRGRDGRLKEGEVSWALVSREQIRHYHHPTC